MKKLWKNSIVLSLLGLAFLVFVWGVAFLAVKDAYVLPSPWETVKQAVKLLGKGYFYAAFFATLGRAVLGFAIACVLGVGLAVLAYVLPTLEKLLRGVVAMLRSLPTMAVLLLVLLGVSYAFAPVIIGVLTLFPLMYTATYSSLCGVDRKLLEMSEIYRVPLKKRVMNLYLPTAFPKIVAEGVAALSFSLKLTVSAEVSPLPLQC